MKNKKSASALISDLKRKTRKAYNSEDKIKRHLQRVITIIIKPIILKKKMYSVKSFVNPNFNENPRIAITISDLIQFFKCLTVSKYNGDVKNSSKSVFDSVAFSFVKFEPLLNVIKTVKSVRTKPTLVKLTFDKSEAISKL